MVSANEKRIRFGLRFIRLMMGYMPRQMTRSLMNYPLYRVRLPDQIRTKQVPVAGVPGLDQVPG